MAYVKKFGMVGLFLNGDVDWIQKEKLWSISQLLL